ncbi:MAG: DEAD/DEAH box helicase [Promethearchaeota archaeon]
MKIRLKPKIVKIKNDFSGFYGVVEVMNVVTLKITFKGNDLFINNLGAVIADDFFQQLQRNMDCVRENRSNGIRFLPIDYWKLDRLLTSMGFLIKPEFNTKFTLSEYQQSVDHKSNKITSLKPVFKLRQYQKNALEHWNKNGKRGIVILPTGSGKSFLGLHAITQLLQKTLIVVPTLELIDEWYERILKYFKWNSCDSLSEISEIVGRFGGGRKELRPITIITYSSSYLYMHKFRDYFGFIIFDEVHHLAGEKHRAVATGLIAPNRLGLTATLDNEEEIYPVLERIVGPIIYEKIPSELSERGDLAEYEEKRIYVELSPRIREQYLAEKKIYTDYMKKFGPSQNSFRQMIFRANVDLAAKKALDAYTRARDIMFNAEEKLKKIEELLSLHNKGRILIFSEKIAFVEKISRTFLIPALTSNTPKLERKLILNNFRNGKYKILVTGKVLDEGIDVPEATIGIIVSGSGVPRQYIQRLGRILRPLPEKTAVLYEIITSKTSETRISSRRRRKKSKKVKR